MDSDNENVQLNINEGSEKLGEPMIPNIPKERSLLIEDVISKTGKETKISRKTDDNQTEEQEIEKKPVLKLRNMTELLETVAKDQEVVQLDSSEEDVSTEVNATSEDVSTEITATSEDVSTEINATSGETSPSSREPESETMDHSSVESGHAHIDFTKLEKKYLEKNKSALQRKLTGIVRCTSCYQQLNHVLGSEVFEHPVLGVLVCKKCRNFYADGVFTTDDDGLDEYCRWCAQGGDLLLCDFCSNGFCKQCIKRNIGRTAVDKAMENGWRCYVCDIKPLVEVRSLYKVITKNLLKDQHIQSTMSRVDKKHKNIQQKFAAYRKKRDKSKKQVSNIKPNAKHIRLAQYISDLDSLLTTCVNQLAKVNTKHNQLQNLDVNARTERRLLRLTGAMKDNFTILLGHLNKTAQSRDTTPATTPATTDPPDEEKGHSDAETINFSGDESQSKEAPQESQSKEAPQESQSKGEPQESQSKGEPQESQSKEAPQESQSQEKNPDPLDVDKLDEGAVDSPRIDATVATDFLETGADEKAKTTPPTESVFENVSSDDDAQAEHIADTVEHFLKSSDSDSFKRRLSDTETSHKKQKFDDSDCDSTDTDIYEMSVVETNGKDSLMNNEGAKNALLVSSTDDDSDLKVPKKNPTKKSAKKMALKDCKVIVHKVTDALSKKLQDDGCVQYTDLSPEKSIENESDAKLNNLLNASIYKKCKSATPSGSDASGEDSDTSNHLSRKKKKTPLKSRKDTRNSVDSVPSDASVSDTEAEEKPKELPSKQHLDLNATMKESLLLTSDDCEDEEEKPQVKKEKPDKKVAVKKEGTKPLDSTAGKKRGYVSLKFSSSETSSSEDADSKSTEEDSDFAATKSKKRKARMLWCSDSDDSDSSLIGKPKPTKRAKMDTSSSAEEPMLPAFVSPSKKKNRKILRDEDLLESTKDATQREKERRARVKAKGKLYNEAFEAKEDNADELVLDFDQETNEKLVVVDRSLSKKLKPHQKTGIKFMWNASFESVEQLEKNDTGSGCILAHCMGLGKTLQVVALVHTLFSNRKVKRHITRVLVCAPLNTLHNWIAEFRKWLKSKMSFEVTELVSAKDLWDRAHRLDEWYKEGGVMIIGYDMFRSLLKVDKGKLKDILQTCLVSPGPDLIICDEGHIIKNEKTALALAINKVATKRRIVLTGTPLQNNLNEYYCMIQFVKKNLLGAKKEFTNRFLNPIESGQAADATAKQVKTMKKRAHILHNMLEGCVQRFDYTVLKPYLLPKYEYVLSIQMSELQCKLYSYYLENLAQGGPKNSGAGLFVDFHNLGRVWSHPLSLYISMINNSEETKDSLDKFVVEDSSSETPNDETKSDSAATEIPPLNNTRSKYDWWTSVLGLNTETEQEEFLNKAELSGKLMVFLNILQKCSRIGDKMLVFSQSLISLDVIENFLSLVNKGELKLPDNGTPLPNHLTRWQKGRDYLRLDGSVGADTRKQQIRAFNNVNNDRCRLFLISTRAGGIGINLVAANRVVLFDVSWNPAYDTQSLFRVYRFGQLKPCYVYRLVSQGTMEEKIYSRQVAKISTARRVVDEHQIKRYFKFSELAELYRFSPADPDCRVVPKKPDDAIFAEILLENKGWIVNYHEHDSLLENQMDEQLTEQERKDAWEDFENEKKVALQGPPRPIEPTLPIYNTGDAPLLTANDLHILTPCLTNYSIQTIQESVRKAFPSLTAKQLQPVAVEYTRRLLMKHEHEFNEARRDMLKMSQIKNSTTMLQAKEKYLTQLASNIARERQVLTQYTVPQWSSRAMDTLANPPVPPPPTIVELSNETEIAGPSTSSNVPAKRPGTAYGKKETAINVSSDTITLD